MVTSALTFNKSYCNKVVAALGVVRVSKSYHIFRDQPYFPAAILSYLRLPVFVKPAEGGSSIGMSKVNKAEELEDAIQKAFKEDNQILIEEFIKGTEVTCGVFRKQGELQVLPSRRSAPAKSSSTTKPNILPASPTKLPRRDPRRSRRPHPPGSAGPLQPPQLQRHRTGRFYPRRRHQRRLLPGGQHHARPKREQPRTPAGTCRRYDFAGFLRHTY